MKITVSQKAKDVENGEKKHAAIFTAGDKSLLKPEKTTEAPSISIIEAGNNSHKNEELLSNSINWKLIKFSLAQIVCGILLIIMEIPLLYWTKILNDKRLVDLSVPGRLESKFRVGLAGSLAIVIAGGIGVIARRKKPKCLVVSIYVLLQYLAFGILSFTLTFTPFQIADLINWKTYGIEAELNFNYFPNWRPRVKIFGEELNFAKHSHPQLYCPSQICITWMVLEGCMALTDIMTLFIIIGAMYEFLKQSDKKKMAKRSLLQVPVKFRNDTVVF